MKKNFVLREEVIDVFHNKFCIPTMECLFLLAHVSIFGSMVCGNTRNDYYQEKEGKIF